MKQPLTWFGTWAFEQMPAMNKMLESYKIPVPVGEPCHFCGEPIAPHDSGVQIPHPGRFFAHRNCHVRNLVGSVAHIEKRCGCFVPGSTEDDPPGMTKRQAANAAVKAFDRKTAEDVMKRQKFVN